MKTSEIKQTEHSSRSAEPKCTHAHCCRMCKCMSDDRPITRRENDARAGRRRLALLSRGHDHDGASARVPRCSLADPTAGWPWPATRCPVVVGRAVTWHVSAGAHPYRYQQANQSVSSVDDRSIFNPGGKVPSVVLITCVRSSPRRLASYRASLCCPIHAIHLQLANVAAGTATGKD